MELYYEISIFHHPQIHWKTTLGAWLSLVERSVRDREVGGSNPLAPTTIADNAITKQCLFE